MTNPFGYPHVEKSMARVRSRIPRRRPELTLPDGRDASTLRLTELSGLVRGLGISSDGLTKEQCISALKERLAS